MFNSTTMPAILIIIASQVGKYSPTAICRTTSGRKKTIDLTAYNASINAIAAGIFDGV